jgi:hypothetical protein
MTLPWLLLLLLPLLLLIRLLGLPVACNITAAVATSCSKVCRSSSRWCSQAPSCQSAPRTALLLPLLLLLLLI